MRLIDADKLYPDCMTKKGTLAISQNQIANATTVKIDTNDIEYKAYSKGLEDGKKITKPQEDCGEWIFHENFNKSIKYGCNQCGNLTNIPSNFCPNCGKRMKKYSPFEEKGAGNEKET